MKKQILISLMFICLWEGCNTNKHLTKQNNGSKSHYHLAMFKKNLPSDSATVVIQAFTVNFKTHAFQNFSTEVKGDTLISKNVKNLTKIIFSINPGNYRVKVHAMGFYPNETSTFFINKKDSIKINFYMQFKPIE